jgi:hypothetical protein
VSTLPEARIVHRVSGRTRIKIPSRRKDHQYFGKLIEAMANFPGLQRVEANPLTGSVLLEYDDESASLAEYARSNKIFKVVEHKPAALLGRNQEGRLMKELDRQAQSLSMDKQELSKLAVVSLLGLSAYQISRGNFQAPAWYTALWYAYNIYLSALNDRTLCKTETDEGITTGDNIPDTADD